MLKCSLSGKKDFGPIPVGKIEKLVKVGVRQYFCECLKYEKQHIKKEEQTQKMRQKQKRMDELSRLKISSYEAYKDDRISKDEFLKEAEHRQGKRTAGAAVVVGSRIQCSVRCSRSYTDNKDND